jgi:hypothetical protein
MPAMTRPASSSKVLLVAARRGSPVTAVGGASSLRRYRLARLRLEGRATDPASRFEYLKRAYD